MTPGETKIMFLSSRHGKKNKRKCCSSFSPSLTQPIIILVYKFSSMAQAIWNVIVYFCPFWNNDVFFIVFLGRFTQLCAFFNALFFKLKCLYSLCLYKTMICFTKIVQSWGVVIFHPNEITNNTLTYAKYKTYRSIVLTKSESLAKADLLLDVFRRQMSTKKSESSISRVKKKNRTNTFNWVLNVTCYGHRRASIQ